MHRRKSSKEEENVVVFPAEAPATNNGDTAPPRIRVNSTPAQSYPVQPASAGPYRTSFGAQRSPNGLGSGLTPTSPFRTSFSHSHSRTRSVSTQFAPPLPSPLSTSFPMQPTSPSHNSLQFPASSTAPELSTNGLAPPSPQHSRRHSRLHSRNLSVFFPRPGSLPHTAIAEDGGQELEITPPEEAPVSTIPSAGSSINIPEHKQLKGFTFGGRPPSSEPPAVRTPTSSGASRRGHHHKHSLSHNFFSFLEPGSSPSAELHTQPTPVPMSPWNPISPFPSSAGMQTTFPQNGSAVEHEHKISRPDVDKRVPAEISSVAAVSAVAQFFLGAWLWVSGQQIGSLACTGLGYWVVFDAFGVALASVLPGYLSKAKMQSKTRRPYGNARVETVAMFSQAVYLMFSSVYVCKETVEHLLLSAGEGHHHHHGDEDPEIFGIVFPTYLIFTTLISLAATAIIFNNHAKLVNITDNRIPSPSTVLRALRPRYASPYTDSAPTSTLALLCSNPYSISPIVFCLFILSIGAFIHPSNFRLLDLALATVETVVTFKVAYRASVVLGTVLLQTSPPRGLAGGGMEAFLRTMRELERHPKVLHLPAPHIWQLTPTLSAHEAEADRRDTGPTQSLVVTLELHVRADLPNDDVLELTRWAWERCVNALHFGTGAQADVTVGVVRG